MQNQPHEKTKLPATGTNPYQYISDTLLLLQSKVSKVQSHHNSEASLLLYLLNLLPREPSMVSHSFQKSSTALNISFADNKVASTILFPVFCK